MDFGVFIERLNLNRPDEEIALDLIRFTTGFQIPRREITFGLPRKVDQRPDLTQDENTFIPVNISADYDCRFLGEDGFMYRRISLALLQPDPAIDFIIPSVPFTTWDILDQINAKFRTQLKTRDVINTQYAANDYNVMLRANPISLVWCDALDLAGGIEDERILEDGSSRVSEDGAIRILN